MKTVRLRDIDLAVSDQGSGRPLVLVHGFPLTHAIWDEQVRALAPGRRVLAPDLRGFGQSGVTPGRVTMDQFAHDLAAMLDALEVAEPVVLAGLSMGGYIAMRFFELYRRRLGGLVLCDTRAAADTPQAAAARRETAARVECEGPGVLAEGMLPRLFSPATLARRPELVESLRQMILGGDPWGLAAAARGLADRPDFTPLLPRIDLPVLVIVGSQDAISPPEEMGAIARAVPGARYVEIPAAGHMAPLEQPAAVSRALAEFLTAAGRSTGS
ncbi:MAG: alpha/beta fold hydrolase [Thermoguttaceae bacterium]|jgi:pimeloyl-ACP methyl ester carboxylesterase